MIRCPFWPADSEATATVADIRSKIAAETKRCRWVKPEKVCQIKFTEWTRDDRLRQPVFLRIREDKNANEVVREKAS
jgi:ATP-dependent DNA ligase